MKIYDDEPPTAASAAIRTWYAELLAAARDGMQSDQGVFVAPLPPAVAQAGARDFRGAHWALDADTDAEVREVREQNEWCAWVYFSQNHAHQAMLFASDTGKWEGGPVLWIDGQPMPVPRAVDGSSRIDDFGEWFDDRYFVVNMGGFYDHPQFTISWTSYGLGNVRGLWIYDVVAGSARSVVPHDDEKWPFPVAEIEQGRLVIYASPQDRWDRRVARQESL